MRAKWCRKVDGDDKMNASLHVALVSKVNFLNYFCVDGAEHKKRCDDEIVFQKYIPPQ